MVYGYGPDSSNYLPRFFDRCCHWKSLTSLKWLVLSCWCLRGILKGWLCCPTTSKDPFLPPSSKDERFIAAPTNMQCPFTFPESEPLRDLCNRFNVMEIIHDGPSLPTTMSVPILRDFHLPTHILAVFDTPKTVPELPCCPLLVPVNYTSYIQRFRVDIFPSLSLLKTPYHHAGNVDPSSPRQVITLPIVPVRVPHAPSMPLLLLFGLGLETRLNSLASRLLPLVVIEEFPSPASMADTMARTCDDEQLLRYAENNHGLWKNILALAPTDMDIVQLVRTAWNITAEARRLRKRARRDTL